MRITGIILAGGSSSRIGREKAFIEFEGQRLVDRSIRILEPLCEILLISSNNPALHILDKPVLPDEHHGIGPLAGLHATLKVSNSEHHLVIPCDVPRLTIQVYEELLLARDDADQAVIAGTQDGYTEPLIAYYHHSALPILEAQIEKGNYKLHDALDQMMVRTVVFQEKSLFTNINSPSDLKIRNKSKRAIMVAHASTS